MSKGEDETPPGYITVDLPKVFAAMHTRGLKASVNKAKLLQVLEEAEEKSKRKNKSLGEELKQLREEYKRLKEKINEKPKEDEGTIPKAKKRKSFGSSEEKVI
ncbi:unnamed protein product [Heligmosomoides polygyrus]|uniref:SAP domain-containing protein n=1 Tax=Heligmosomoides polygyrus TaxID=6339 RepID=A0A183FB83_HELPZ|nr:unnamed protein product [Heligmosomoides polygyrus]